MAVSPQGAALLLLLAVPVLANASAGTPLQGDACDGGTGPDQGQELLQVASRVARATRGPTEETVEVQPALGTQDGSKAAAAAQPAALVKESTAGTAAGTISTRAFVAEFVAMALFVFFGCGSAMSIAKEEGSAWVLQVSLSFGLAITVLAYSIGHISGGQINCAVTLGLVIYGHVGIVQGICNFIAQMLGSLLGAMVLKTMYPVSKDLTGGLATNSVSPGWTMSGALMGEFVGTFLLMFVVFHTAVNGATAANSALAPLAIGLSVFLAHSVLIPVDGCSINPTRTFGPAVIHALTGGGAEAFNGMWVFWLGPLAGAAAAAGVYALMEL